MKQKDLITNERGPYGSRWQSVWDDDEKDRIAQEQSDLEGYSLSAVWGQVESNNVHHHQEYTGQQEVDCVEQRSAADHNLVIKERDIFPCGNNVFIFLTLFFFHFGTNYFPKEMWPDNWSMCI